MDIQTDIQNCIKALRDGGSILYPTDTVWGLGCDATNQIAVEKLLAIKERSAFQGLIVLVANESDVVRYGGWADAAIFGFLEKTAKPTTVIYGKGRELAPSVLNADGSIAIRLVKDAFCQQLLHDFGKPIVSTSANIHSQPTPSFFKEISGALQKRVNYIVHHRREDETPRESSALIRLLENGLVETIRP